MVAICCLVASTLCSETINTLHIDLHTVAVGNTLRFHNTVSSAKKAILGAPNDIFSVRMVIMGMAF